MLYSSCMFELILLASEYAADRLISAAFPFESLCCWMTGHFVFIDFTSLFVSMLVLVNMEIIEVNQLCSCRNGC
jgi:hypothetical protein